MTKNDLMALINAYASARAILALDLASRTADARSHARVAETLAEVEAGLKAFAEAVAIAENERPF
jgi:hypothetical protein